MRKTAPIRVLIADDHAVVRAGLATMIDFEKEMEVVAQAGDGEEALALYENLRPDVALLDLQMPKMDGVATITAIRERFLSARIMILTTFSAEEDIYRGLQAGAKGYLLKDAPREELLAAIRAVHAGQTYVPAAVGAKLAQRLQSPALSEREAQILRFVSQGRSNKEIGVALDIGEGTVKTHMNHLLQKLGALDRTHAVTLAIKRGLLRLD